MTPPSSWIKLFQRHGHAYEQCPTSRKPRGGYRPIHKYARCYNSNANVTRPDGIIFMTVNTTITRGPKSIAFTQSFELPQAAAVVTLQNGNPRHAHTYTGPYLMRMTPEKFANLIVEPSGHDTPCSIRPPGYGEVRAQLNNVDEYKKLCRRHAFSQPRSCLKGHHPYAPRDASLRPRVLSTALSHPRSKCQVSRRVADWYRVTPTPPPATCLRKHGIPSGGESRLKGSSVHRP